MKRMLLLFSLICLSAFVFADDTNSDVNFSVTVYPEVDISIDGNSVVISTDEFSWTGFCGGQLEDTLTIEALVYLDANAACPAVSGTLTTVLDDYRSCVSLLGDDTNSLNDALDLFKGDLMDDFNGLALWFTHGVEASVSENLSDFKALIENTFVPVRSEFEALEGRLTAEKKINDDLNITLRACQVDSSVFNKEKNMLISEVGLYQILFALAVVVVMLLLLYHLGFFDRFSGGRWGAG